MSSCDPRASKLTENTTLTGLAFVLVMSARVEFAILQRAKVNFLSSYGLYRILNSSLFNNSELFTLEQSC